MATTPLALMMTLNQIPFISLLVRSHMASTLASTLLLCSLIVLYPRVANLELWRGFRFTVEVYRVGDHTTACRPSDGQSSQPCC